jgi:hypothetical protein
MATHVTVEYFMSFLSNNCSETEERCFLHSPCWDVISRTSQALQLDNASHAALPFVISKFRPNTAPPPPTLAQNFTIMQPSDHMRYLYQKDKRALPGNLQNRRYSFLSPHPKCSVSHYHPLPLSFFLCLSLSLSLLPLGLRCCELLLLEADSWGMETVRKPRGRGKVRRWSRYQATTSGD